jgi:hypothetical protein
MIAAKGGGGEEAGPLEWRYWMLIEVTETRSSELVAVPVANLNCAWGPSTRARS